MTLPCGNRKVKWKGETWCERRHYPLSDGSSQWVESGGLAQFNSKCSVEILQGQLVSFVRSFSEGLAVPLFAWILGRLFWAKPVLRMFSGPRIGPVGGSCFVDDFVFLLGQVGCISVAAWTQLKVAFFYFVSSGGLLKRAQQHFAALGDCLKCFLPLRSFWVFAQVAGFHLNGCIEYFTAPCWVPLPL